MKTYYFKIREKFIENVKNGIKCHEYRLASPDNRKIKIGDNLLLVSNQNKSRYVRTSVLDIVIYTDWKSALEENWEQDFKDIFPSLDEALKECYKFYPKTAVDEHGIIAFSIQPVNFDLFSSSILLDTNIVIKRESGNNVSFEISKLFNWIDNENIPKYIHELTKQELSNYRDETVRKAMLTKLSAYNILSKFALSSDAFFEQIISRFSKDKNSEIDNSLLLEVYNDNVGCLLTDDTIILKKAELLYIRDRVLCSAELLEKFESKYPSNIEYQMLAVRLKRFDEVNLSSQFFDTLREDYEGQKFDQWFKKKGNESAYVFEDGTELKGFLYLKTELENEPDYLKVSPYLSPKKRLKVGTFKIERTGFRLGERFLRIIFDNARKLNVKEIYVTLFENKREDVIHLKSLMEDWGFYKYGTKSNGEIVLVKSLEQYDNEQTPKYNYPLLKNNPEYYFLPIFPEYHTDLFPDLILKNEDMHLYKENKAHRYALEKVYITAAKSIQASPGDIVLIYRTGNRYPKKYSSVITGIAIVEEIIETHSPEECISICKNRSIFGEDEIRKQYIKRKTVIKLLDYLPFKTKVTLEKLYDNQIIEQNQGPRPFEKITNNQYDKIFRMGMDE